MERVVAKQNVLAALQRVERNKGAAGPDGMNVKELRAHLITEWPSLKMALLSGTYVPQAVRRVDIPKPDGGTRQLGIPSANRRKFLGYSFFNSKKRTLIRVAPKSLERFKAMVRTVTNPHNGWSMKQRVATLTTYLRGWFHYFKLARTHTVYEKLDKWVRRRLRLCLWL